MAGKDSYSGHQLYPNDLLSNTSVKSTCTTYQPKDQLIDDRYKKTRTIKLIYICSLKAVHDAYGVKKPHNQSQ